MPRSVRYEQFGGPEVLQVVQTELPEPGPGTLRIRVRTAGLNPVDHKIFSGGPAAAAFGVTPPAGVGRDFAGLIDAVGAGVSEGAVGTEVFGMAGDTLADYIVIPADQALPKPEGLSWDLAGGLGVVGRTAVASVRSLRLGPHDTVLVSAAAGGVGVIASQLAVAAGATVVGTASPANHEFLAALGVIPVAYGPGLVERLAAAAPQGYTAVLDNHGDETIAAALELGVPANRINTIASYSAPEGVTHVGGMAAQPEDLLELAEAVAAGSIQVPVAATYPIAEVVAAYQQLQGGHLRGKIVVTLD